MDLSNALFAKYGPAADDTTTASNTKAIAGSVPDEYYGSEHLKKILGFVDLTTLNPEDNDETARRFTGRLNEFPNRFPGLDPVAAVCVYPALVEEIRKGLTAPGVRIAAVGAGFPSSQTFLAVKLAECGLLVNKGADEIDVVMSVGRFLQGDYEGVFNELILIREATAGAHLKVILETGLLKSAGNIRLASLIAMEAGADFIKTSTGKIPVAATPEAVYTMTGAIRDYRERSGRMVGIKPAGGISDVPEAVVYYHLVNSILGREWISPEYFRIGASRLANRLISRILEREINYF